MLAIERKSQIIAMLREKKKVVVSELSKLFNVTEETIRKDLKDLENNDFIVRGHGGAVLKNDLLSPSFIERETINFNAKQHIAALAEKYIEDGMTLMVDTSTTASIVVQTLPPNKSVTIITNSYKLISDCSVHKNLHFIATGGHANYHYKAYVGRDAFKVIRGYNADCAILGCNSISKKFGFMESNELEADVKIEMAEHSRKIIIVADSSKLDKESSVCTINFNRVDCMIMEKAPPSEWVELFKQNDISLSY
jgi:DeoR/GlpR family transcriptional regulator of sugar metabolism